MDRADALRDQVGVLKVPDPDRAIETLCDEIDEAIAVAGHGSAAAGADRAISASTGAKWVGPNAQRHGDAQAAAQIPGGKDRFPGRVDLGAGPGRMIPERDARFRQRRAAGGSGQKLHAEFRFDPEQAAG